MKLLEEKIEEVRLILDNGLSISIDNQDIIDLKYSDLVLYGKQTIYPVDVYSVLDIHLSISTKNFKKLNIISYRRGKRIIECVDTVHYLLEHKNIIDIQFVSKLKLIDFVIPFENEYTEVHLIKEKDSERYTLDSNQNLVINLHTYREEEFSLQILSEIEKSKKKKEFEENEIIDDTHHVGEKTIENVVIPFIKDFTNVITFDSETKTFLNQKVSKVECYLENCESIFFDSTDVIKLELPEKLNFDRQGWQFASHFFKLTISKKARKIEQNSFFGTYTTTGELQDNFVRILEGKDITHLILYFENGDYFDISVPFTFKINQFLLGEKSYCLNEDNLEINCKLKELLEDDK